MDPGPRIVLLRNRIVSLGSLSRAVSIEPELAQCGPPPVIDFLISFMLCTNFVLVLIFLVHYAIACPMRVSNFYENVHDWVGSLTPAFFGLIAL